MLRRRQNTILSRSETTFLNSKSLIRLLHRRDLTGKIQSNEAEFVMLDDAVKSIQDYGLSLFKKDPGLRYNVTVNGCTKTEIVAIQRDNEGRWNFDDAKTVYTLKPEEFSAFKAKVVNTTVALVRLFETYFSNCVSAANNAQGEMVKNDELGKFLHTVSDARIRNLRELCHLYLACEGQTFMDVIGHLTGSNVFTFQALFNIFGLYYVRTKALRGYEMLKNAARKNINSTKNELHTVTGLVIPYDKTFTLALPVLKKEQVISVYSTVEVFDAIDESSMSETSDAVSSGEGSSGSGVIPKGVVDNTKTAEEKKQDEDKKLAELKELQRLYEAEIQGHVLSFEGSQKFNDIGLAFSDILTNAGLHESLTSIDPTHDDVLLTLLTFLNHDCFVPFKNYVHKLLCPNDIRILLNKLSGLDMFVEAESKTLLSKNLIYMLACLDEPVSGTKPILTRLREAEDLLDFTMVLCREFINLF